MNGTLITTLHNLLLLETFVFLIVVVGTSNNNNYFDYFFDNIGGCGCGSDSCDGVIAFVSATIITAAEENASTTRQDQVVVLEDEDRDNNGRYYGDNYDPSSSSTIPNENIAVSASLSSSSSLLHPNICSVCIDPFNEDNVSHNPSTTTLRIGRPDRIVPFIAATSNNTCQNIDDMLRSYEQTMNREACDIARKVSFGDFLHPASFCSCYVDNVDNNDNSGDTKFFIEPPMLCPFCTLDKMLDPDWILSTDDGSKSNNRNTTFTCRDAAKLAPFISDDTYCSDVYTSWRRGCCYDDQEFDDNDIQSRCSVCNNDRNEKMMNPNHTVDLEDKSVKRCGDIEMEIGFLVGDECSDFLSNVSSFDMSKKCGCSNATEDQRDVESSDAHGYDVSSMDTIWLAPIVFIIGSCFYVCLKKLDSMYDDGPDLPSERWRQHNQRHDESSIDEDNDDDATGIMNCDMAVSSYDTRKTKNRSSRLFQSP